MSGFVLNITGSKENCYCTFLSIFSLNFKQNETKILSNIVFIIDAKKIFGRFHKLNLIKII